MPQNRAGFEPGAFLQILLRAGGFRAGGVTGAGFDETGMEFVARILHPMNGGHCFAKTSPEVDAFWTNNVSIRHVARRWVRIDVFL